jgi:hypothetical protein
LTIAPSGTALGRANPTCTKAANNRVPNNNATHINFPFLIAFLLWSNLFNDPFLETDVRNFWLAESIIPSFH